MDKKTERQLVKLAIHQCHSCNLRGDHTPVAWTGHTHPAFVVIGQGNGPTELKSGIPWSGKVGTFTKKLMREAGIELHKAAWMNVVCCGEPKPAHVDACRLHFNRQLNVLDSRFLLVFGNIAANAMLGFNIPMKKIHGKWWQYNKSWVMATYHPASVLHARNPVQEGEIRVDLERFYRSVALQDLAPPKLRDYCVQCDTRVAVVFQRGLGFCRSHAPTQRRRLLEQLSLFE